MASSMAGTKQVKVDNWGIFFLQRLKHFFNRTDYCDLTLQFQDYAQLKVHRLVLNACTEYFELLERTCEMYDDVLIMPDDLQADVVVPIVNFMYTGQLEYEYSLYERLYSTAQIMNMTVLTKLLDAQKASPAPPPKTYKKEIVVMNEQLRDKRPYVRASTSSDYSPFPSAKKRIISSRKYGPGPGLKSEARTRTADEPRPTRYEIPEELDSEDIFESSFADLSYESRPLMRSSKPQENTRNIYDEASSSRKFEELKRSVSYKRPRSSSSENRESKHIDLEQINEFTYQQKLRAEYVERDNNSDNDNNDMFDSLNSDYDHKSDVQSHSKEEIEATFGPAGGVTQTVSVKQSKDCSSMSHAKIISEVLKKYPHLVKNNGNLKLKILTGPTKDRGSKNANRNLTYGQPKKLLSPTKYTDDDDTKPDWTYISKNMNSEAMAKLVSMGAENTTGPWLCLICGTPGKALNFVSYIKFYRHLVEVHKEKINANICEYCGYKSGKRNHLLHHMYTKHEVPPPSTHSFPKCNQCPYVGLTEAFLIKHKMSHTDNREFSCNVCNSSYRTRSQLLNHIQLSGHKISAGRKPSSQCVYCSKIFLREANLYMHLKLAHKATARKDGIIDNSEEDDNFDDDIDNNVASYDFATESQEEHVNIKEESNGKIQIISNVHVNRNAPRGMSQKLLNSKLINRSVSDNAKKGYGSPAKKVTRQEPKVAAHSLEPSSEAEALGTVSSSIAASLGLVDRIVVLGDEYILQADQAEQHPPLQHHVQMELDGVTQEIILSDMPEGQFSAQQSTISVSMPQQTRTSQIMNSKPLMASPRVPLPGRIVTANQNRPIQIVVSGSQQYKSIVSSTPIVYANANDIKTTVANVHLDGTSENIELQSHPEGEVMVLQEEDFNMACSQTVPADGSNIVVVYSHPVEGDGKHYLQVGSDQFQSIADIESNMQRIHGESDDIPVELTDQGLVHETVESWQEDAVAETVVEEKESEVPESVHCTEDVVSHEEIKSTDDKLDETVATDYTDGLIKSSDELETAPEDSLIVSESEVVVSCQTNEPAQSVDGTIPIEGCSESDNNVTEGSVENEGTVTCTENEVTESETVIEASVGNEEENVADKEVVIPEDAVDGNTETIINTEDQTVASSTDAVDDIHHNGNSAVETEQCMEIDSSLDYQTSETDNAAQLEEDPATPKSDQMILEWSDDDATLKLGAEESVEVTSADAANPIQPIEVEESIENIQEEVSKHIQDNVKSVGVEEETNDLKESDDPELLEDNDTLSSVETVKNDDLPTKEQTVEKISHLLNDWEDNDSQSEVMEVDSKKAVDPGVVQKDSNIDKLVSDWDDEDEK